MKNTDEYDVDTVLLVKENDNPKDIMNTVGKIRSTGESVSVQTEIPTDIRYRRVLSMEGVR